MSAKNYTITIACKGEAAAARAMWLAISRPQDGTDARESPFHELACAAEKTLGGFSFSSAIDPNAFINTLRAKDSEEKPEHFYSILAKTFPGLKFFIIHEYAEGGGAEIASFEAKNGRMRTSGRWRCATIRLYEAHRAWLGALQGHWLSEAFPDSPPETEEEFPAAEPGSELARAEKQTPALCLAAVEADGEALAHVKKQTPKICRAAVENSGLALRFVKKQSAGICRAAIEQNPFALRYVKDQTRELCLAAVRRNYLAYGCVRETFLSLFKLFNEAFQEEIKRLTDSGE